MKWDILNGEQPLKNAPVVRLDNGAVCIPQHYLAYAHNRQTLEQIILDCDFDDDYLIMAAEDAQGLYIQIGIIGYDTYKPRTAQSEKKIVYGRRWRVERHFPTSELIQTIFLAIKKAREHEVRERFKLCITGRHSSPFSTHQDLPLIASQAVRLGTGQHHDSTDSFRCASERLLQQIRFDHSAVNMVNIETRRSGQILIDLTLTASAQTELPESHDASFTLILTTPSTNELLFALMEKLIERSDRYVDEHFCYRQVNRFSRDMSVQKLAGLSLQTRQQLKGKKAAQFYMQLEQHNACIDAARAPHIDTQKLAWHLQQKLPPINTLAGFPPKFSSC
ncbi:hypothetical protein [Alteromonas gilva]|uniref:Uncharacterized protein n=1 Tax=Alteromonas gilva TaxID=2987522 RepID=A0ABT5KYE3_9ALTE|nr:hypothetical protein [Alteromonas gilva]MDC8829786.1 hypothetical protein [Alteromonas gilva]